MVAKQLHMVSAGVFDGHGFNGRSAATYARKNITKWLSVDGNAASKDPKRRLKALESVCGQIDRGLARLELCSFDASSSGLTACFGILQGNQICLATLGMHSVLAFCSFVGTPATARRCLKLVTVTQTTPFALSTR
jgi:serine/threonine protein phosphatase PrpC